MKNTFKRITAILISAILMLSVLTACGEAPTLISFLGASSDQIDYDGMKFVLADTRSSEDESLLVYKANTNFYDLALQRFADVEEAFNCEIERKYIPADSKIILADIVGGARKYDILYTWHEPIQLLSRGKALTPVYDYRDIVDLSDFNKYGTSTIQEANAYGGEIYAVSPQSWLYNQPTALDMIAFNLDLVEKYGKTNPREFIENGTWNWDALEMVVSDYYVKDGDKEVYSIAFRALDMLKLLCLGNGVKFTYKDSNGELRSDFGGANMLEAVNFYNRVFSENADKLPLKFSGEIDWGEVSDAFIIQQNTMAGLTTASYIYNEIAYEVENYVVMPFPTGPRGEYGVWPAIIEGMDGYTVPITCEDKEAEFRLIDAFCEPLEGYETEESRIEFLAENVVFDPIDAEIALTAHKNGTYSYWKADVGNFGPDLFWRKLAENPGADKTARVIGQYEDKYNTAIANYMTPNLEIEKYFND